MLILVAVHLPVAGEADVDREEVRDLLGGQGLELAAAGGVVGGPCGAPVLPVAVDRGVASPPPGGQA